MRAQTTPRPVAAAVAPIALPVRPLAATEDAVDPVNSGRASMAPPADITLPAEDGEAPAAIVVPEPPGAEIPMEVVVAAEVLRRVKRTRQAVNLVSQVVIRSYEEEALHAEVCRHLVGYGGYLMAWIGLAEEEPERIIRPIAHDGLEPNFLGALRITWANDLVNTSPTSLAMQEQRPQVARNILKEPRFAVLRKEAQLYGYTATCALPLQFAQYGFGVLTIHAMEPDAFNAEEVSLLRELASDVSAGVISLRERGKRRALELRLAAVVDAADNAIIGTDVAGTIQEWNEGATRMFGYLRSEAVGRPVDGLLVPPEHREAERKVRQAVAAGERPPRYATVRVCKEGRLIHTSVTVTPILSGEGKTIGMTAIEHDITRERVAEAASRARHLEEAEVRRLHELDKLRRTFLSEASHELKTPLTPLVIHVEALREAGGTTVEQNAHHVEVIHRNVDRLRRLVDDMLESSRLETGRFSLNLSTVELAPVLRDAVEGLAEDAREKGIRIQLKVPAELSAECDGARVGQVLHNVLGNAISFTPRDGRISVSAAREGEDVVVHVTDTGLGLTATQLAKLFQPFSRPHEGTGSAPKGTGLGLFISKGIIEQHGGRIWAESPGPGGGSTFSFCLPRTSPAGTAGNRVDPPQPAKGAQAVTAVPRASTGPAAV